MNTSLTPGITCGFRRYTVPIVTTATLSRTIISTGFRVRPRQLSARSMKRPTPCSGFPPRRDSIALTAGLRPVNIIWIPCISILWWRQLQEYSGWLPTVGCSVAKALISNWFQLRYPIALLSSALINSGYLFQHC